MQFLITVDWKFVIALGIAVSGVIMTAKMDPKTAGKVSTKVVDACKEYALAEKKQAQALPELST